MGFIRPCLGPQEFCADDVSKHFFKGKPVTLIHGKEKTWEHEGNHQKHGGGAADNGAGKQVGRDTDDCRHPEAYKLALSEIERHFRFYFG